MNQSAEINELAASLSKAQAEMEHAQLDSRNPAFKREGREMRYPSLRSVIEAYKPALAAHGLAIVQTFEPSEPHTLILTTCLLHSSGQWLSGTCTFPVERPGPQGYASASTYARRYSLMALVGLAPEDDDDGNAAQAPRSQPQPESRGDDRETLIAAISRQFKELHPGERFREFACRVLKREVTGLGDVELADLRALDRHLRTEAAVSEGQARVSGEAPA